MDPLNFTVGGHSSLLPKSMGGSRSLSLSRQSSLPGGGGSRTGTIHVLIQGVLAGLGLV